MIQMDIPGWGKLKLKNLVLDFNGTIAKDGKLIEGVEPLLRQINDCGIALYIITADTNGTVKKECSELPAEVLVYKNIDVATNKMKLVQQLGAEHTATIGNGRNDAKMFKESVLSIAVIGKEGTCTATAMQADILVTDILNALELFTHINRLKATLRG